MNRTRTLIVATAAFAALLSAGCGSTKSADTADTTVPATTTTVVGTTTSTGPAADQRQTAVWPDAAGTTRYADPVEAARTFAVTYLGFVDPVVGAFAAGDSRSGEVPVRPRVDGPETTVLVRQLGPDDTWWVLGAATANIQLDTPAALTAITSPVTLAGRSTAFEATVNVEIRRNGADAPLASGYVMGGANGEMGPFSQAFTFTAPTGTAGAVVLRTISAESGATAEATVVAVTFSG
jgi:hypothetical protein